MTIEAKWILNAAVFLSLLFLSTPAPSQILQSTDVPSQAQAKSKSKPDQLCTVEGTVVNANTGEPAKKVTVMIYPAGGRGEQRSAIADTRGQFLFRDVEPGRYMMQGGGNGYPFQAYGQRTAARRGKLLNFDPGHHEKDLVFRLMPGSVITGTVYDEDGDPVMGANVQTFRARSSLRQMVSAGGGQTDDRGQYRIYGLEPGQYYLLANHQNQEAGDEPYLPTYYPGTSDATQATTVQVRPGDELSAINVSMTRGRGLRVRGRVVFAGANKSQAVYVQLMPRRGSVGGMPFGNYGAQAQDEKGNFEIRGVPPGSYFAIANWSDGKTNLTGRATVEVENTDVENAVVVLGPPFDVRGRVRTDSSTPFDFNRLNIWMQQTENMMGGGGPAELKADGTFVFHNLFEGDYQIRVAGFPEEYYLKSARMGGSDVLASGFTLSRSQSFGTLDLELSANGGSVSGTVLHDQKPVPEAVVVLVPDPPNRHRNDMYSSKSSDQLGKFSMPGLPSGDFKLFSFETLDGVNYEDPEFFKPYESHGKSVHIEEKHSQSVQLDLIPAEEDEPKQ